MQCVLQVQNESDERTNSTGRGEADFFVCPFFFLFPPRQAGSGWFSDLV